MNLRSLSVFVTYSQVAVFQASLENPFNFWTSSHVDQGFAWRAGSASFQTIEEGGTHAIDVVVDADAAEISSEATRVIEVPFEVPDDGAVLIGSISEEVSISIRPGSYALRFEYIPSKDGSDPTIRLVFIPSGEAKFQIVRVDSKLRPPDQLVVTADPAI
jgi:hypothetical protein